MHASPPVNFEVGAGFALLVYPNLKSRRLTVYTAAGLLAYCEKQVTPLWPSHSPIQAGSDQTLIVVCFVKQRTVAGTAPDLQQILPCYIGFPFNRSRGIAGIEPVCI